MSGGALRLNRSASDLGNVKLQDAREIAEATARASYGRLLAFLAARTRNIAAAEDALADAFAAALEHWPTSGVPDAPEAWLLTAARRKLIDAARRETTRTSKEIEIQRAIEEAAQAATEERFVDERLKLLFICAHPAIDASVRTPLMLQTVLGVDAARIASAFLVAPATMSQRLVRAKKKITAAAIAFEPPGAEDLPNRAAAVLESIYAAFGAGYDDDDGTIEDEGLPAKGLSDEAIFLGDLAATLLPDIAEAHGLRALMLYIHARRAARRVDGRYVALADQDPDMWNRALLETANAALGRAAALQKPGRYQLEAAIQSAHMTGRITDRDTRIDIVLLYDRLIQIAPSVGAVIARAAAYAAIGRHKDARASLMELPEKLVASHQPYWATLAHIEAESGNRAAASNAYDRAIGLCADSAARRFLVEKRSKLDAD